MSETTFFSRDISWLSFNQRVLMEAAQDAVPAGERLKFLSIYSSNLDEFYRVRMPVLMAKRQYSLSQAGRKTDPGWEPSEFEQARDMIQEQQEQFGQILRGQLIPLLAEQGTVLLYQEKIPEFLMPQVHDFFFTQAAAFLQPQLLAPGSGFFPENNKLYFLVQLRRHDLETLMIVNIPSDDLSRFFTATHEGKQFILFIDDVVREHLAALFPESSITGAHSFKITRDAELDLHDELPGDLAEKLEKLIARRDRGLATRLLHEPGLPLRHIQLLCTLFRISISNALEGGTYHNLRDMAAMPLKQTAFFFAPQRPVILPQQSIAGSLLDEIARRDISLHPPYHQFGPVLRFFNEAAIDPSVEEIYCTLYRIAGDSMIAHALSSAARNGKKVFVFVELKARFDEANNIRWSKRMKESGVKVVYSIPKLKVHAKIALVKRRRGDRQESVGMLSTGNLNESTARFYTDHILFTAHPGMLQEGERLFLFLANRKKPDKNDRLHFNHLLVAQFNLQQQFLALIEREIVHAREGRSAGITIKVNNLEEQVLIRKLYEASNAGVQVQLIVRSICCLVPGVRGMSENITVKRIVSRYLEHGRVFIFRNGGEPAVFMGSADWMNRNIYTRIEVCFPVYDPLISREIQDIIQLQLSDNTEAVWINSTLHNVPVRRAEHEEPVNSQAAIYEMLSHNIPS